MGESWQQDEPMRKKHFSPALQGAGEFFVLIHSPGNIVEKGCGRRSRPHPFSTNQPLLYIQKTRFTLK